MLGKKNFADRLSGIKSVFTKSLEDAKQLSAEMDAKKAEKLGQIKVLQDEITAIADV